MLLLIGLISMNLLFTIIKCPGSYIEKGGLSTDLWSNILKFLQTAFSKKQNFNYRHKTFEHSYEIPHCYSKPFLWTWYPVYH